MSPAGPWRQACLVIALVLGLWTDLTRFRDPVGEKYVSVIDTGGADFALGYLGARALVKGADPYRHDQPRFADPYGRDFDADGTTTAFVFLPTHLLLHAPLAVAMGPNVRRAARVWFHLNVGVLLALAVVTALVAREVDPGLSPLLPWASGLAATLLALQVGTQLGFERGQVDLLTSLLCWSGVLLAARGRAGWGLALLTAAALVKGYAAVGAVLVLLALRRSERWRGVAGAAAAVALLLGPVAGYLPVALAAARARSDDFSVTWVNHGFRNLVHHLRPEWAGAGRVGLTLLALAAALACARAAAVTLRTSARGGLPLTLVVLTGLVVVIGYSGLSNAYNMVLVLPGVLVLALTADAWMDAHRLAGARRHATGALLAMVMACLWLPRIGQSDFPLASLALVGVSALGAWLSISRAEGETGEPLAASHPHEDPPS
jgi:hypothetical protein